MSYGEIKASRNRCPKARNNGCSCSELPKDIFYYIYGRRSTTISLWESRVQANSKNTAPMYYYIG